MGLHLRKFLNSNKVLRGHRLVNIPSHPARDPFKPTAVGLVHGQLNDDSAAAFPAFVPDTLSCPAPEGLKERCSAGFSIAQMPRTRGPCGG
jgi:hypothetical protein